MPKGLSQIPTVWFLLSGGWTAMHALSNKNQSGYISTLLLISATLTLGSMEVHMALYGEGEGWEKPPHLENNLTWAHISYIGPI